MTLLGRELGLAVDRAIASWEAWHGPLPADARVRLMLVAAAAEGSMRCPGLTVGQFTGWAQQMAVAGGLKHG
jgi:hypothetical protein